MMWPRKMKGFRDENDDNLMNRSAGSMLAHSAQAHFSTLRSFGRLRVIKGPMLPNPAINSGYFLPDIFLAILPSIMGWARGFRDEEISNLFSKMKGKSFTGFVRFPRDWMHGVSPNKELVISAGVLLYFSCALKLVSPLNRIFSSFVVAPTKVTQTSENGKVGMPTFSNRSNLHFSSSFSLFSA